MNTKEHALTAIARLLEVTEAAIRLGDWKVDGACDPDAAIEYAKHVLVSSGYAQNSNDDSWTAPAPEPRSTHRVWRDGEWLPCYCLAGCDHGIGSEQLVKRDHAELVRLFNSNDWPRPGAERESPPLTFTQGVLCSLSILDRYGDSIAYREVADPHDLNQLWEEADEFDREHLERHGYRPTPAAQESGDA